MHSFFYNASELLQQAEENRHRLLVTVSGEYQWAEKTTEQLLNLWHADALWVSDKTLDNRHCIDFNTSRRWLGRELNYLVFDAHSSFDPNVFSLLCGTVKAGGALLLLTPPLRHWQYHPDPVNKRCSVWNAEVLRSRYLDRLSRLIPAHSQLLLQQSGKHARRTNSSELSESNGDREQQNVVQAIAQDFKNSTRPQLHVISGDRGRGKSSALGRLAARLIEGGAQRVLLTAPRKAAVDLVLKHAELDTVDQKSLREKLVFVAPDRLVLEPLPCDVLLVDEMGGIHLGLLKRLLQHYTNTVLAGTVHGYEGAGRGFHTRFKKMLDQRYSHCQWHRLEHPMRWGPSDPLEHSSNALMMLDAEAPTPAQGETTVHFLNRDQLSLDEPLLRQIHGLLAAAHYRTRPLDLRQMLDGPNIQIAVSKIADTVVAACLLAVEGPMIDKALNREIVGGRRRPAGHLLPQLLMQRLQIEEAACLSYSRIVRIAVHPERQGQGLGSQLLDAVQVHAQASGVDCLGSLFAVDSAVLKFWQRVEFTAVMLGDNCEATSGSYALTILKPLNAASNRLVSAARKAWSKQRTAAGLSDSHPALNEELRNALNLVLPPVASPSDGKMNG